MKNIMKFKKIEKLFKNFLKRNTKKKSQKSNIVLEHFRKTFGNKNPKNNQKRSLTDFYPFLGPQ